MKKNTKIKKTKKSALSAKRLLCAAVFFFLAAGLCVSKRKNETVENSLLTVHAVIQLCTLTCYSMSVCHEAHVFKQKGMIDSMLFFPFFLLYG